MSEIDREDLRTYIKKRLVEPDVQELAKKLGITPGEVLKRALEYYKFLQQPQDEGYQARLKLMDDQGLEEK